MPVLTSTIRISCFHPPAQVLREEEHFSTFTTKPPLGGKRDEPFQCDVRPPTGRRQPIPAGNGLRPQGSGLGDSAVLPELRSNVDATPQAEPVAWLARLSAGRPTKQGAEAKASRWNVGEGDSSSLDTSLCPDSLGSQWAAGRDFRYTIPGRGGASARAGRRCRVGES